MVMNPTTIYGLKINVRQQMTHDLNTKLPILKEARPWWQIHPYALIILLRLPQLGVRL